MNKIVSTKRTSAIFLAIVLVAGTIAAISPSSFIIKGVNAQGDPYYGMDNGYNSYGYADYRDDKKKDDSYGYADYRDDKKKDDSYGYADYGKDRYDDRKSYDKKPYGNDNGYYESQYTSSYKPDYKPKYTSYDKKDDRDKSTKDSSSKSIDIKKIKCNNININLNNGQGGNGNGDNGNKTDGFKKINRGGFTFICINNNNNVVTWGSSNQLTTCKDWFTTVLTPTELNELIETIENESELEILEVISCSKITYPLSFF